MLKISWLTDGEKIEQLDGNPTIRNCWNHVENVLIRVAAFCIFRFPMLKRTLILLYYGILLFWVIFWFCATIQTWIKESKTLTNLWAITENLLCFLCLSTQHFIMQHYCPLQDTLHYSKIHHTWKTDSHRKSPTPDHQTWQHESHKMCILTGHKLYKYRSNVFKFRLKIIGRSLYSLLLNTTVSDTQITER